MIPIDTEKNSYHHGNLRSALINAGIKMISEEGFEHLSLRKAAMMCDVSHAAPKSHFKSKEAFERAIRDHVTQGFTAYLKNAADWAMINDPQNVIRDIGRAYVKYFYDYPDHYWIICNRTDISIAMSKDRVGDSDFPPFQIFKECATALLGQVGVPTDEIPKAILTLWSLVNGLASISIIKGFHYDGDWMEMVNSIVGSGEDFKKNAGGVYLNREKADLL